MQNQKKMFTTEADMNQAPLLSKAHIKYTPNIFPFFPASFVLLKKDIYGSVRNFQFILICQLVQRGMMSILAVSIENYHHPIRWM